MSCAVCDGTGMLLLNICPLCDGDPLYCTDDTVTEPHKKSVWQIQLGRNWVTYDLETEKLICEAKASGASTVEYSARRQTYVIDLQTMAQINRGTGVRRAIRCVEGDLVKPEQAVEVRCPPRSKRLVQLVDHLLSPAVQVQLSAAASEEPLRLSPAEVSKVFTDHVPGVESFLYRDMPGQRSLNFISIGYTSGLNALVGTPLHAHILWLLRVIVHHGQDQKPGASRYLREVAEAFMDCQAVQARVIQRVGLEIRGISSDFKGHVTRLVGEYKSMAVKMLAFERIAQRCAADDSNPTHYENRLIADLGDLVGVNQDEIRQAKLDAHMQRFAPLSTPDEVLCVSARCRELFDVEAFIKALTAELNSFNADSSTDSVPQQFLKWVSESLTQKHVVFDVGACMSVDVEEPLVLPILEVMFLGKLFAEPEEVYRGTRLADLFALSGSILGNSKEGQVEKP